MSPSASSRLDQHHLASLHKLTEEHLIKLLNEILPLKCAHGSVEAERLEWHDPCWETRPVLKRVRRLSLELSVNNPNGRSRSRVTLPFLWPLGEEACAEPYPLEYVRLGGPATFIDALPKVAVSQRTYRPGLHLFRHDFRYSGRQYSGRRLVLMPDIGPSMRIYKTSIGRDQTSNEFDPAPDDHAPPLAKSPPRSSFRVSIYGLGSGTAVFENAELIGCADSGQTRAPHGTPHTANLEALCDRLLGQNRPPLAFFSDATRERISEAGIRLDDSSLQDLCGLLFSLDKDGAEPPEYGHELSEATLRTQHHGDILESILVESLLAAVERFHLGKPDQAAALGSLLKSMFQQIYDRMHRGGDRQPALLVTDDDRNTLANLEARRKTTRYSPEIPREIRYWLWTRDIDPSDRRRLCPLQTPESADLGYVRFLALGDGYADEHSEIADLDAPDLDLDSSDLSAAASLIPFINHNDPTRSAIGSKNLKQALPLAGASAPRIRSGTEAALAEAHGTARLPAGPDATVLEVFEDRIIVQRQEGTPSGAEVLPFGYPHPTGHTADGRWKLLTTPGDTLSAGTVFAHAPDVVIDCGEPTLALGTDVLVAFTPWLGMNYEDAIVASEAVVDRMASLHSLRITEPLGAYETLRPSVEAGAEVVAGDELLKILGPDSKTRRSVVAPESGVLEECPRVEPVIGPRESGDSDDAVSGEIVIRLRTSRRLAVGDKLTNRHGGKGVVSAILPPSSMPKLPDGRHVEMILNPLGVIRRLNIGQLFETHESLLADLEEGGPRVVGRRMSPQRRGELASALAERGAPGGRLVLECADGTVLDRHGGVVAGWQYMLKLDHLVADKRNERLAAFAGPRDRQPVRGSTFAGGVRRGGAKRCGEMEIWALRAKGASEFLDETLTARSGFAPGTNPTLASVDAHLRTAQLAVDHTTGAVKLLDARDTKALAPVICEEITEPTTNTPQYASAASHGLYRPDCHGDFEKAGASCACGAVWQSGARCASCHTTPRPDPHPERLAVRYHIKLPAPVKHPWFRPSPSQGASSCVASRIHREHRRAAELEHLCCANHDPDVVRRRDENGRSSALERVRESLAEEGHKPIAMTHDCRRARLYVFTDRGRLAEFDLTEGAAGDFVRDWFIEHRRAGNPELPPDDVQFLALEPNGFPVINYGKDEQSRDILRTATPALHVVPILPPAYRRFGYEPLDTLYERLIRLVALVEENREAAVMGVERQLVRAILGGPTDKPDHGTISGRLNGKHGLIRRGLRGRHNNSVARNVITPQTTLGLEEVGLPSGTMAELQLRDGDVVVVNRQPTLRPSNVVALRARAHDGDHVALHPMMSKQLAGDFDGDEVTLHCPSDGQVAVDTWRRLRPTSELLNDTDGQPIMAPDLDVALGVHLLSMSDAGRVELSKLLDGGEEPAGNGSAGVESAVGADQAVELVRAAYSALGIDPERDPCAVIEALFEATTRACLGWSASLLDDAFLEDGARLRMLERTGNDELDGPRSDWLDEAIAAGVAGGAGGLRQLFVERGSLPTFTPGKSTPRVGSCFLDGLSSGDVFATAPGALAALVQKKLVTPQAGHVTKRLADALYDFVVAAEDCGVGPDATGHRDALHCALDGSCCAACVGPLPSGRSADVGDFIGLRAAMLIGERCTQKAMKTFHGGGTSDDVRGIVPELEAAFGFRANHPQESGLSFRDALKADDPPATLRRLAGQTAAALDGGVHESLICVALRRVHDLARQAEAEAAVGPLPRVPAGPNNQAARANPLLHASTIGHLRPILDSVEWPVRHGPSGQQLRDAYWPVARPARPEARR